MRVDARQIKLGFLAFDLFLGIVVFFFIARTIHFLLPIPAVMPEAPVTASPAHNERLHAKIRPYDEYDSLRKSNLFGALSSSSAVPPKAVEEQLPETTLELELLGCVAGGPPESAFAIIRDKRARTEDTYGVGDFVSGDARVDEIRESEVVISRAGRREVLSMVFGDEGPSSGSTRNAPSRSRSSAALRPSAASSSDDQDVAIRVVNENLRYVNRAKLMADMGQNLGSIMNQVQVNPNTVDGKPSGISVEGVGSDPVLGQSGLQAGDVVKSVNGVRVNSLDDVLGLADRLQSAPEVRVVVERQGRHRTLVYKLR